MHIFRKLYLILLHYCRIGVVENRFGGSFIGADNTLFSSIFQHFIFLVHNFPTLSPNIITHNYATLLPILLHNVAKYCITYTLRKNGSK